MMCFVPSASTGGLCALWVVAVSTPPSLPSPSALSLSCLCVHIVPAEPTSAVQQLSPPAQGGVGAKALHAMPVVHTDSPRKAAFKSPPSEESRLRRWSPLIVPLTLTITWFIAVTVTGECWTPLFRLATTLEHV